MSNKLKKFIWDNRKAFDDAAPSDQVWQHIEASFTERKKKKIILTPVYKWSMAAAAMLIISVGAYFIVNREPEERIITAKVEPVDIYMIAPDIAPEMSQFVKMIDTKQEELKQLAKDQPELYQEFATAINQLDSSYNNLKSQLGATPNKEMLLEAMIQNLQLQLNVLNQQLNIIHQIKEAKKV